MRTRAAKPSGIGLWHVTVSPESPDASAPSTYSSGSPKAWLQSVVWEWCSNSISVSCPFSRKLPSHWPPP